MTVTATLRRSSLVVLAVVLACGILTARASADAGVAMSPGDFLYLFESPAFTDLVDGTGAVESGAAFHWARFDVSWDTAGTALSNGSCTQATSYGSSLSNLIQAMDYAKLEGMTPVVAFKYGNAMGNTWPAGASDPINPTTQDFGCAYALLVDDLASAGALPSTAYFETYNEPQGEADIGDACAPGSGLANWYCAADYYEEAELVDELLGRHDVLIAGTFEDATASDTAGTYCFDSPDGSAEASGGFDWDYMCAILALDSEFHTPAPTNWSFHDYIDVADSGKSGGCTSINASGCVTTDAQNFHNLLASYRFSTSNVWVTEAGTPIGPTGCGCLGGDGLGQAEAAEGFLHLRWSGLVAHMFWYEFQTYGDGTDDYRSDNFDSALLGIDRPDLTAEQGVPPNPLGGGGNLAPDPSDPTWGESGNAVPRYSYCVLAFNEAPAAALNDPRCGYVTTPENPNTDWQDGNP